MWILLYQHTIQCVDTFVLDLKGFYVKGKSLLNYTYLFLPNDYEKMIK